MSTVAAPDPRSVVVLQRTTVVAVREAGGTPVVTPQIGRGAVVVTRGVPGPKGEKGDSGGSAGATYTHTQAIPLAVWTVPHNLNRRPSITVTDPLGNVVAPDVRYIDNDIVQVTHGTPLTGFAYCN